MPEMKPLRYAVASWVIAAALLVLVLQAHLLAALLPGLLVYELVHVIAPRLPWNRVGSRRLAAVGLLATLVIAILVVALIGFIAFLHGEAGNFPRLLQKMAEILDTSRQKLPDWLVGALPGDPEVLQGSITEWLRSHAEDFRTAGGEAGRGFAHVIIGMVIGGIVSLHRAGSVNDGGPLAVELSERARRIGDAFQRVVFAQLRISALNTIFTAIYLEIVLRLFGVHVPLTKTLIVVTFVAGLLPVVGNLVSNTMIVIVSLAVSFEAAVASFAFLVVIHKLEYFLNAKIVGARIKASSWELLLAMLVMEAVFGIPGLVAAPIYYAYLKDELSARGLV
jgi:predicted PurR-regulated permease PerM